MIITYYPDYWVSGFWPDGFWPSKDEGAYGAMHPVSWKKEEPPAPSTEAERVADSGRVLQGLPELTPRIVPSRNEPTAEAISLEQAAISQPTARVAAHQYHLPLESTLDVEANVLPAVPPPALETAVTSLDIAALPTLPSGDDDDLWMLILSEL